MEHFIKYIPHREPGQLLLILDGHKSHIAIDIIEWAKQNNIVIFVLPAHIRRLNTFFRNSLWIIRVNPSFAKCCL
jgi:L-ascorbate metabolism protein UlaG (beta-lactamase superfamily)